MMYANDKSGKGSMKTKKTKEGAAKRKKAEQAFLKMAMAQHQARNRKTYAAPKPKD
jgi:hypothetical protein